MNFCPSNFVCQKKQDGENKGGEEHNNAKNQYTDITNSLIFISRQKSSMSTNQSTWLLVILVILHEYVAKRNQSAGINRQINRGVLFFAINIILLHLNKKNDNRKLENGKTQMKKGKTQHGFLQSCDQTTNHVTQQIHVAKHVLVFTC